MGKIREKKRESKSRNHFHSAFDSHSVQAEREDYEPNLPKPCISITYAVAVVMGSRKWTTRMKGNVYSLSRTILRRDKDKHSQIVLRTPLNFFLKTHTSSI